MAQTLSIFLYLMITYLSQRINGLSMEMIPIDSPDLGMLPQHLTMREKHQYLANISLSRSYRFQRYNSTLNPDSFETPFLEVKSNYFVTSIEIGKEAHFTYLLLDTGEELTWVQCVGCKPCIELKNKNFDYKKSTYYARMGKTDKLCPGEPYEGSCGLQSAYAGDTKAEGFFGRDDFNFKNSKTGQMEVYKSLAFGCGLENRNFYFGDNNGPDNIIAGIYGLAPSKASFINQLDDHIKGRFSYCIPRSNSMRLTHSILHFGDDAQISGDATRQVQTISMDSEFGYHLYLNKISIDGIRLDIDPTVFMKDPTNLDTGFIIDTGAPYTVLVKSAHDTFVEAIAKYYREKYGWNPLAPVDGWHLCYKGDYRTIAPDIPPVIFHFLRVEETEEVDMYLDSGTMFVQFSKSLFCVMVRPTDEPGVSILGAFHQSNFRFLYDIHNNLLQFVPEKCQQI